MTTAQQRLVAARDTGEGAGILFLADKTKTVLWVLRSDEGDAPNVWAFPGGGVEEGETHEQAALREAQEEIGFRDNVNIHHIDTQVYPDFKYYTFLGVVDQEFTPILNDEHTDYQWLPAGEFPKPIHPGIEQLKNKIER